MPRDLFAQPLFSPKLIKSRFAAAPIPSAHLAIISEWAQALKGSLGKDKEESVRPVFLQRFFVDMLGYELKGGPVWTLVHENKAAFGSVDAALGVFTHELNQVVAPFELKGPRTTNLEALMPGRHKSPVQQAWEYANDLPGSQFVLVSNCDEVRLYALGYGRAVYESWHVTDLLEPRHYASFVGLLHAERLVNGHTQALLKESALQEREITQALYLDYKTLRQELMVGLHHFNPQVMFADLIRHAQKLIDRLIFIAFAESRNLLPKGAQASLGDKLGAWWLLPDFKAFSFEVSKRFKIDIPLRERNDWEQLFTQGRTRVHQLSANIAAAERSIDVVVYELFGLSPTEVTLIERSVKS